MDEFFLFSEEHGVYVWFPSKTGSNHSYKVLKSCGFKNYMYSRKSNSLSPTNLDGYGHSLSKFPGNEHYSLISTARHPYTRLVSYFKFLNCFTVKKNNPLYYTISDSLEERKFKFRSFLNEMFASTLNHPALESYNTTRVPNFFLRVENLYEDYCKIPFIFSTIFRSSGELEKVCLKKENENKIDLTPWQEYFDQYTADLIYSKTENYCNLLGYDKDIWK